MTTIKFLAGVVVVSKNIWTVVDAKMRFSEAGGGGITCET